MRPPIASRTVRAPGASSLLVLLAMAPACNWGSFADEARNAPVRSIGAPDSFKSQDFGRLLVPLSDGQGQAAAFIASSLNDTNLVRIEVDARGGVSQSVVPQTALSNLNEAAISTLVEIKGMRKLLLGAPVLPRGTTEGQTYSFDLPDGPANPYPLVASIEAGWGRGLATGSLGGDASMADLVIGSDEGITVYVDGSTANPALATPISGACEDSFDSLQDARYSLRRAMVAAPLWQAAGTPADVIITGSPHMTGTGGVAVWTLDGAAPAFGVVCSYSATPPTMVPHFGQSLAVGDFDADGKVDLLVGAPSQQAFVYLSSRAPVAGFPDPVVISDPGGLDFGFAVAALNVDGHAGDEALVADPRATVGGQAQAGQVIAYAWDATTSTMKKVKTYADHSPQANANFGWSVGSLAFCQEPGAAGTACAAARPAHVLLIGAGNEVFLYYREGDIPARASDGIKDVRGP